MLLLPSRMATYVVAFTLLVLFLLHLPSSRSRQQPAAVEIYKLPQNTVEDQTIFKWSQRKEHYPVDQYYRLPTPSLAKVPTIQHVFGKENATSIATRRQRKAQIKAAMERSWEAYRRRAWMMDELAPVSGLNKTTYGGWAATLVDSLDTLWIMDMKPQFEEAVNAIVQIDFTSTTMETINLFETTIRYMGGFIAAFDLSGDRRLLDKALELADMIYAAFDTPNRMPILRWDFHAAARGERQVSPDHIILAEIGSLCMEFTRLSQITHHDKWYDAVARITNLFDEQQGLSQLPGMWPLSVNGEQADFHTGDTFSLAAFSDSMYEYLPKMYALLGGSDQYARMYRWAMSTATQYMLYSPMIKKEDHNILLPGTVHVEDGGYTLQPELQHLVCFVGGMLAVGGRLLKNETHVDLGRRVTDGCTFAYSLFQTGVMPENCNLIPCQGLSKDGCAFDTPTWHEAILRDAFLTEDRGKNATTLVKQLRLPSGVSSIRDRKYHLRPEAIESVFVLYRITGDTSLQEIGWKMFRSIHSRTRTAYAYAAMEDVTNSTMPLMDNMESFWTAETLKYFYLLYSDPDVISLDEWVFNTEAHPFRRPGHDSRKSHWFSWWK
ncbi:hypothetical protein AC579_999 [Pseudocercospora musae]|uniref:alpha-1,2-Mannosidase n=1 Tax=Pseudocercospora musae TaxID=113226 RepID=A0A139IBI5_9PEZI|nr:hypothetical protein AC579_999 [Pseudocercospora musae]